MSAAVPRLSLCMIVRDSARTLAACLDSIRPWVDEMIVVDTGSNDNTREIARDRGAHVFEFPWIDDFSAARNESLRRASGEWIFWMDSDDTIDEVNGRGLRTLAESPHPVNTLGYVVQVHCPSPSDSGGDETTVVDHVKLIRNDARIRFEGRIHEQVLPAIRRLGGEVGWTDLFVVHSGAEQSPAGKQRKIERDLRILELDLQERPDHPFVLFNLGMTYDDMGQHAAAENWLRKCLANSAAGESHVRKAYALLASCLDRLNRIDEAKSVCQRGLALFSDDKELLFRQGLLEHRAGNLPAAVAAYQRLLHANPSRHFTSVDRGIAGYKTRHNLAILYAQQGKYELAELLWRQVLRDRPNFLPAVRGLVDSLLNLRRWIVIDSELTWWREQGMRPQVLAIVSAEFQAGIGEIARAINVLRTASVCYPQERELSERLCQLLFEHGRFEEAHEALRQLVTLVPQDASAWHNLGMAAMQLGHDDEAVEYLERSVALRPDYLLTENALQSARQRQAAAGSKVSSTNRVIAGLTTPAQEVLPMAG